jgi:hypothetical protein
MERPSYEELEKQVATLEKQLTQQAGGRRRSGTWRRIGIGALIAVGSLALVVCDFALWANRNLVSTDGYVRMVAPLAQDPRVQAALVQVADQKIQSTVGVEQAVASVLPPNAAFLAPTIATQVDNGIKAALAKVAASPQFAQVWTGANQRVHERLMTAIAKHADNGQITLDDVYAYLGQRLKDTPLGGVLQRPLPAQLGSIQVVDVKWLPVAHAVVEGLQWAVPVSALVALAAFGGALWASLQRRKTLIAASLTAALVLALGNIAVRLVQQLRLGQYHDAVYHGAAQAVQDAVVGPFIAQTRVWILVALVLAVGAWATGPFRAAVRMRAGIGRINEGIMRGTGNLGAGTPAVRWLEHRRRLVEAGMVALAVVALLFMTPLTIAVVLWTVAILAVLILLVEIVTSTSHLEGTGGVTP